MPGVVDSAKSAGAGAGNKSKNALRRAKKKEQKATSDKKQTQLSRDEPSAPAVQPADTTPLDVGDATKAPVQAVSFDIPEDDPLFAQYKQVASRFTEQSDAQQVKEAQVVYHNDDNDEIPDEEDEEDGKTAQTSAKRRQKASLLSVAELKAIAKDPMLVEEADRTSADPLLLISIKAQRNVVPVPSHWSVKRDYLSSKRGIEKSTFTLPKFIQDTGIQDMRDAVLEKQADATLKQKQRERVQPKMGKLDLDFKKLYDAFFRFQTKPVLTRYGEVYFEGKENEASGKHLRPGDLSNELREALAMGAADPPPWLYQQQRFGPPPGYPGMQIPGLNAPIPYGASWGYESGQFGKIPVDEYGTPLYGGYLDQAQAPPQVQAAQEPIDKTLWGEVQPRGEDESEEEEESDEEEEEEDEGADADVPPARKLGTKTPLPSGVATTGPAIDVGGIQSMAGEDFALRKNRDVQPSSTTGGPPRAAYEILPEQNISATGFFGGERAYDLGKARGDNVPVLGHENGGAGGTRKRKAGDVEVSLDVDALQSGDKLSKDQMRQQYEAGQRAQAPGNWQSGVNQEDLSAMIDEESNKRIKKDRENADRRRHGR